MFVAPTPTRRSAQEGIARYVQHQERAERGEPPHLRGLVFKQSPDGTSENLRFSGQTTPEGPDIPVDAVVDGSVLISVDGIGQEVSEHHRQIKDLLHGGSEVGANLQRPVLGVHEGSGPDRKSDLLRIGRNVIFTKALQSGLFNAEKIEKIAYRNDPSVKAVKDLLQQALESGLKVTLMAHSGGGSQVALALNLLSRQNGGLWKKKIPDNVRVLSLAGAASSKDYSGVRSQDLLYTGSRRDDVYKMFHNHLHPWAWHRNLPFLKNGVEAALGIGVDKSTHALDYIFAQHETEQGNRLEGFLRGVSGGGQHELA